MRVNSYYYPGKNLLYFYFCFLNCFKIMLIPIRIKANDINQPQKLP